MKTVFRNVRAWGLGTGMGALKLLQIVANLLPLILVTIKEIHPLKVRHPATCSAVFPML